MKSKRKNVMLTLMCAISKMIHMNLFARQKQIQRQRTNVWTPMGDGGGMNWETGILHFLNT